MADADAETAATSNEGKDAATVNELANALPVSVEGELPSVSIPQEVAGYQLVKKLGEGGMGTVYLADDPNLGRRLAIKLLRRGSSEEGSTGQARLLREAQAMAKLSHPNVVAIYEVGSVSAGVFIAMEFVEGKNVAEWLEAQPRSWREVVGTFVQAGEGLAAAHALDLVHRDFKPVNVMVGDDRRVRVLDFGLARGAGIGGNDPVPVPTDQDLDTLQALQGTPVTQAGLVMGTPAYMAPEQHFSQPTGARGDQFSFCVSLYEALYGQRPFSGANRKELRDSVFQQRFTEPAPGTKVPAWLRRVVLRGLSVRPEDRWPSMEALLDQLRRDPAAKLRRASFLTAAVLASAAVASFAYATLKEDAPLCTDGPDRLSQVWSEEQRSAVQEALVGTGLPHAPDVWERVDTRIGAYSEAWLAQYSDACEATHIRGDQSAKMLDLRMTCLERRRVGLAALVEVLSQGRKKTVDRAVHAAAGLNPVEGCADQEALLAAVPPPDDPQVVASVEEIRSRLAQVEALRLTGGWKDALPIAERIGKDAELVEYQPIQAETQMALGRLQDLNGDFAGASKTLTDAFWLAAGGVHDEIALSAATHLVFMAGVRENDSALGLRWADHAKVESIRSGSERTEAILERNVGALYQSKGDYETARTHLQRSLEIREKTYAPDDPMLAKSLVGLANLQNLQGDQAEARRNYERALETSEASFGPTHPSVALILNNMAIVLRSQGETKLARETLDRALEIRTASLGDAHPDVASTLNNLATVAMYERDFSEAVELQNRALAIYETSLGPDHLRVAIALNNLCETLRHARKPKEARETCQRALEIREQKLGPDHARVGTVLLNLAGLSIDEGAGERAVEEASRAVAILRTAFGEQHAYTGLALQLRGEAGMLLGESVAAIADLEAALVIQEAAEADPGQLPELRFALARALWKQLASRQRAIEQAQKARAEFEAAGEHFVESLEAVDKWLSANAG